MKISKEKLIILGLIAGYLISRLINITILPIFNDESIYLHWAQIMAGSQDKFFSVAYDGKQPLGMWLFASSMFFLKEPLLAGRLVSVIFGLLTLLGIFFLGKKLGGFTTGFIAGVLYLSIPYTLFFDKMALMESAVSSAAVWSLYFSLGLLAKPKLIQAVSLGLILGFGFWFKSTGLIFLVLSSFLIFWFPPSKKKRLYLKFLTITLITAFLAVLPLMVQPSFMNIFRKNQEFTLTFAQLLSLPLTNWSENTLRLMEILSGYISPLFVPILLVEFFLIFRKRDKNLYPLLAWNFSALFLLIIFSKNLDSRYLLFTIPGLLVFVSLTLAKYPSLIFPVIIPAIFLNLVLINSPASFFAFFPETANFASDKYQYVTGWPSGYGVRETIEFIQKDAKGREALVGVRQDSGNPEDAVWVYLQNNPRIKVIYFLRDENFWKQLGVVSEKVPVYFVSRDNQLLDQEINMSELARFVKPGGKSFVTVQKVW